MRLAGARMTMAKKSSSGRNGNTTLPRDSGNWIRGDVDDALSGANAAH